MLIKEKDEMLVNNNWKTMNNEKGITLISLIVTIVVLFILAGITMTMIFSDNNIIKKAKEVVNSTEKDKLNTEQGMKDLTDKIEILTGNYDVETGWNLDIVKKETIDGQSIPVPKGYTLSRISGENSVDEGLVLYEGEEEVNDLNKDIVRKTRNQFVWIPVNDINTIYGKDKEGKKHGKIYKYGEWNGTSKVYTIYNEPQPLNWTEENKIMSVSNTRREPDVVKEDEKADCLKLLGLNNVEDFCKQLQSEFDGMINSIQKYNGFYIGRYETGNLETNIASIPTIKMGNEKTTGVNWYYMYQNSKNIKANSNVTTSMIWGCLWDKTLQWIVNTNNEDFSILMDSTGWGNIATSEFEYIDNSGNVKKKDKGKSLLIPTGSSEHNKKNNIYDLAGNSSEWILEALGESNRTLIRSKLWKC